MIASIGLTRAPWLTWTKFCSVIDMPMALIKRREAERTSQRAVGDALDGPAVQCGDASGEQQGHRQGQRDGGNAQRGQEQQSDQGEKGARP